MTHRDVLRERAEKAKWEAGINPSSITDKYQQNAIRREAAYRYALRVIEDVERLAGYWETQGSDFSQVHPDVRAIIMGDAAAELRDILKEDA